MVLNYKIRANELNDILNEWDFLPAAILGVTDEYTDLIDPILGKLDEGISEKEFSIFLKKFLDKRYGYVPNSIDIATKKIIDWWDKISIEKTGH